MFALIAAVLFVLGVIIPDIDSHNPTFWLLLGLASLALHFAYTVALPRLTRQPPQG